MTDLMRNATFLARLGFAVFPLIPNEKAPLTKHGCKDATRDLARIEEQWSRNPEANIGIGCGLPSNVLALDIDRKHGVDGFAALAELETEFGPLPRTVRSRTPSGGGHMLFAHPLGTRPQNRVGIKRYSASGARRVYAGLDVRANGAYIVAPPSRTAVGEYVWELDPDFTDLAPVPEWLLRLLLSEPPPGAPVPLNLRSDLNTARYVVAAVEGESRQLASTPKGSRNNRLFIAAARLGGFVAAGVLRQADLERALEVAAEACSLTRDKGSASVRATIASGVRHGLQNPRAAIQ